MADLQREEHDRLVARFGRRFVVGETLYREGDRADQAFLLQEGRVRLLKRVRLAERSLMVVKPGELFGETALTEGGLRGSTAVGLSAGLVLAFDRQTFQALLSRQPEVAIRMIEQLTHRLSEAEDQIELMLLRDSPSRIVGALLRLAIPTSQASCVVSITPVELSCRVGLDVETVKRTVAKLRDQEYIRIRGEEVEIPDLEALRRYYALLGAKEEVRG
jgi:CRP-like cAMP-binding protein